MAKKSRQRKAETPAPPARQAPAPPATNTVLVCALLFYLAILATMVVLDSYAFVLKSMVVPLFLLAALFSGRLQMFVNDWGIFLGLILLFDAWRSLIFALITHFEWPMYAQYAIAAERWLLRGAIAPLALQTWRSTLAHPQWLDRLFVLFHASHFLFFLLFGFAVWYARRDAFRTYAVAMLLVLYGALLIHIIAPTIPPWLAAEQFQLIEPVSRLMSSIYNVRVPSLVPVFDVNPIAAMPSLHAALPALCALLALRIFGAAGAVVLLYAIGVWTAVMYLGEHYLIDVIAGIALALAAFVAVDRWPALRRRLQGRDRAASELRFVPQRIGWTMALVACGFASARLASAWITVLPVNVAFVQRELSGRSTMAHYLLGRLAFDRGDFPQAEIEMAQALNDLQHPEQQKIIRGFLGQSAFQSRDFSTVISALEPLRSATSEAGTLTMLGNAYVGAEQYDKGIAVLQEARQRFPAEPEPLYWLTRLRFLRGEVGRDGVEQTIQALSSLSTPRSARLQHMLLELLRDGSQTG